MRTTILHRRMHETAFVHWLAKRRKTTAEKIRMDIKFMPPSKHIDDVYYVAVGKRSEFSIVAGCGDVLRTCPGGFEKIGNIFSDEEAGR